MYADTPGGLGSSSCKSPGQNSLLESRRSDTYAQQASVAVEQLRQLCFFGRSQCCCHRSRLLCSLCCIHQFLGSIRCQLVGCIVVSGLPLRQKKGIIIIIMRCGGGVAARLRLPGACSGLPCPVPACCCHGHLARAWSGSHSGVELAGGVRSGPGEARTILLLHIISVRPSKQPLMVRTFLKVYMELGSSFLFLQELIKDIIITSTPKPVRHSTPTHLPTSPTTTDCAGRLMAGSQQTAPPS